MNFFALRGTHLGSMGPKISRWGLGSRTSQGSTNTRNGPKKLSAKPCADHAQGVLMRMKASNAKRSAHVQNISRASTKRRGKFALRLGGLLRALSVGGRGGKPRSNSASTRAGRNPTSSATILQTTPLDMSSSNSSRKPLQHVDDNRAKARATFLRAHLVTQHQVRHPHGIACASARRRHHGTNPSQARRLARKAQ